MEIYVALAVTALLLVHVGLIAAYFLLHARALKHGSGLRALRAALKRNAVRKGGGSHEPLAPPSSSAAPPGYDDQMEIPAALIGARYKAAIERLAPALGLSPVNLLRAALDAGLTGGRPLTAEMLDLLEDIFKEKEN
jgi:hypothetical protein